MTRPRAPRARSHRRRAQAPARPPDDEPPHDVTTSAVS
jgi:hypothetical protein